MYKESIGIIGGFGAYATLNFFRRLLEEFASDCERNYPHIYMDNNFTMPSRTKALLYGEDYAEIVAEIANSLKLMVEKNVDYIVLPCGTAHAFLPEVYRIIPEAESSVINLIDLIGKAMSDNNVKYVLPIAAEGTLKHNIYQNNFIKYGINSCSLGEEYYSELRLYIESVKRNSMDEDIADKFINFLEQFQIKDVVLGCTEFPVLVNYISNLHSHYKRKLEEYSFWDPLELAIVELKKRLR